MQWMLHCLPQCVRIKYLVASGGPPVKEPMSGLPPSEWRPAGLVTDEWPPAKGEWGPTSSVADEWSPARPASLWATHPPPQVVLGGSREGQDDYGCRFPYAYPPGAVRLCVRHPPALILIQTCGPWSQPLLAHGPRVFRFSTIWRMFHSCAV